MTRLSSMTQPPSEKLTRLISYMEADPDNSQLLGEVLTLTLEEKAAGANQLAARLETLSELTPIAKFALASWYMHQLNWQAAATLLQELTRELPDNETIRYNLAQCFAYSTRFDQAFEILKPLFGLENAISTNTSLLFARSAMHLSEYDAAETALLMLLGNDPDNDAGLGLLALLYRDKLNPAKAVGYAQQALLLNPDNTDANLVLAENHLDHQETVEAEKYFSLVLANKKSHRALRGQAMIHLVKGNADAAEAGFAEIFAIQQSSISDFHLLALAQLLQGNHQNALSTLAQVLLKEPENAESNLLKSMILMLDQQPEQAKSVVRKMKSNPNTKSLQTAVDSLEQALGGNQEQARSLLLNVLESQSPQGKTYGEVISRLLGNTSNPIN